MALSSLNTDFGEAGSYAVYVADLIKVFENAPLAAGTVTKAVPVSDSLPDGVQLGYGYDMTPKSRKGPQIQQEVNDVAPGVVTDQMVADIDAWGAGDESQRSAGRDALLAKLADLALSEEQATRLFINMTPEYEKILDSKIKAPYPDGMPYSLERAALLSLTYNNPSLIGGGLNGGLSDDDRAKCWYEIRFVSNAQRSPGIDNRRVKESATMGFFEGGRVAAQHSDEAGTLQNFIADNWGFISKYISEVSGYQTKIEAELRGYIAAGTGADPATIQLGERA